MSIVGMFGVILSWPNVYFGFNHYRALVPGRTRLAEICERFDAGYLVKYDTEKCLRSIPEQAIDRMELYRTREEAEARIRELRSEFAIEEKSLAAQYSINVARAATGGEHDAKTV